MTRKRDGPVSRESTTGPGQGVNERALPLPQAKTPRNPQGRTPSQHRKPRRRPDNQSWREFRVRLVTKPGTEGAAALYAYLRAAAKRFGIAVGSIDEIHENDHDDH